MFSQETTKKKQNRKYTKQWFSDIEHQEAQDSNPQEGGNKWGKLCRNLLPGLDFQAIAQEGFTLVEPGSLHELRKWSWGLGKQRRLELMAKDRRESCKESSGDLQRVSLEPVAEYRSLCACD